MAGVPGLPLPPLNISDPVVSASNPVITSTFGPLIIGNGDAATSQLPSNNPLLTGNTGTLLGIPTNYYVIGAAILLGLYLHHRGI